MAHKKNSDGIFWKREAGRGLVCYWQIDSRKSKVFSDQRECAMDYVARYVEKHPKFKELVYDKTWDQIFGIFGIKIEERK